MRIAILISGRGSNMLRLADEVSRLNGAVDISLVASNASCDGIELAKKRNLPTAVFARPAFPSKQAQEMSLAAAIEESKADLVLLAGYMAILSAEFVARFPDKIINIHPSLLPDFKGLNTHERALADGVTTHGVSVHLVTAALDDGPILAQAGLTILPNETASALAARVLSLEHALYPFVLQAIAAGEVTIHNGSVDWRNGADFLQSMPSTIRDRLTSAIIWPA